VARDRQRAKQRKQERRAAQNPGPEPTEPHRENVPGELDHASGEVEQFEAAIVAGAGGEPVMDDEQLERERDQEEREAEIEHDPVLATGDGSGGGDRDGSGPGDPGDPDDPDADDRGGLPAPAGATSVPTKGRGGSRFINFLRASWAELQRVQWPDRRQVGQATAVVLGFVVIAGAYLGLADALAQELVDLIL